MSAGLLNGKVALISGAGPGLGRAIALRCAEEGADVVPGRVTRRRWRRSLPRCGRSGVVRSIAARM